MATPQDQALENTTEIWSRWTRASQLTSSSVAAVRARAKAEAAKAQLLYVQKEAEILKEQAEQLKKKAELNANVHLLKSQKEVAAAVAEAQAWEGSVPEDVDQQWPQLGAKPPLDPEQRTHDYVQAAIQKEMDPPDTSVPVQTIPALPATRENNETNNYSELTDQLLSQKFQPLPHVQ